MEKDKYIIKANEIHNGRYDYSYLPSVFKCTDKIDIKCKEHGFFKMIARNHINNKQQCPICANLKRSKNKKYDFETFVKKANEKHNNKYEYIKESYTKCSDLVEIKCKKCGNIFKQQGTQHLSGCGCSYCNPPHKKLTTEEFINQISKSHPNIELLSNYNGNKKYITVRCVIHDYIFDTKPNWLKKGCNCIKCYNQKRGDKLRFNIDEIIKQLNVIHNNKYQYPFIENEYVNNKTKLTIICPEHGEFKQTLNKHLNFKQGCPFCNESHMEKEIQNLLPNTIRQKKFEWLGQQSLDFYLPEYNIAIECQGEQHFKPIKHFGGKNGYDKRILLDENKQKLLNEHNIQIYYIIPQKYYNIALTNLKHIYNKENSLIFEKILKSHKNIL